MADIEKIAKDKMNDLNAVDLNGAVNMVKGSINGHGGYLIMKISKKENLIEKIDNSKIYEPKDAIKIIKENSIVNFNETLDVAINLGIDTNKSDQNIKGVINLPKGTGKSIRVAVVASEDLHSMTKENGADIVSGKKIY